MEESDVFERKREIDDAVDAVYALLERLNRGDVLKHERIRDIIGLEPHEGSWKQIMHRVRRRLLKRKGITLWPIPGVGYELLTVARTLEIVLATRMKKACRQFQYASVEVGAIPEKSMTQHQRHIRQAQLDHARDDIKAQRRNRQALALQLQPTATLPRRPMMTKE